VKVTVQFVQSTQWYFRYSASYLALWLPVCEKNCRVLHLCFANYCKQSKQEAWEYEAGEWGMEKRARKL